MKHTCHRCGRSFARWEHLSRHERSHTKEKPFSCTECSQAFTRKDLLKRHTRLHHSAPMQNSEYANTNEFNSLQPSPEFLSQQEPYLPSAVDISTQGGFDFWGPPFSGDLSTFFDTIDQPTDPFSSIYQPLPYYASPEYHSEVSIAGQSALTFNTNTTTLSAGRHAQVIGADVTSRPPSVQPPGRRESDQELSARFEVDDVCRSAVEAKLETFRHVLPASYTLPSKHTLSRFVRGWLSTFNTHWPMVHLPSASLSEMQVELFLAIATIGAQYCWERPKSQPLFEMSKAIVLERIRLTSAKPQSMPDARNDLVETAQALVLLIAVSMWSQSEPSLHQALFLRSSLLTLVQDGTLDHDPPRQTASGMSNWIEYETAKRTKLLSFCFFNLLTITYDLPPVLMYNTFQSKLPCSEDRWTAENAGQFNSSAYGKELAFQDAIEALLQQDKDTSSIASSTTSLGNYVLIHAIIQHIWVVQQSDKVFNKRGTQGLSEIEKSLKKWQSLWKADQKSAINPDNTSGPLSFTSLALLRLAYIRATTRSGFCGALNIWDPNMIGKSLYQDYSIDRGDEMTRVALHSAQALAIPIKMGINYVAQTQVFYWSNQVALASLECVLLLSKWLEAVTIGVSENALSVKEQNVLHFVVQLIGETEYDAPKDDLIKGRRLSILVVRLWSRLFRRDHVWELISIIGRALEAYADNLEQQEGNS